jgi:hypothetical protein
MQMRFPNKLMAGAALAVVAVSGSAAWAAIPDGSGVIHACYAKDTGRLRVTDTADNAPKKCTSSENALTWNKQGPPAPTPPVVIKKYFSSGFIVFSGHNVPLTSLTVPSAPPGDGPTVAPTYMVQAKAVLGTAAADSQSISCYLVNNGLWIDESTVTLYAESPHVSAQQTVVLMAPVSMLSKVSLHCSAQKPASVGNVVITATPIPGFVYSN